ncbi:MAG TPA: serine hydrolase domain-containing protein [Polyangiaceae bacterium]|jgi:CubicO group peptidase (beta-lactamase class C family)|nr:serine hydrolase domain-containing protein [Polyangiaceae bacterium]
MNRREREVTVTGYCAPGFEPVREAFAQNFRDGLEAGAATSVVVDGKTVVDVWGGASDEHGKEPWGEDTIVQVMSTTKGMTTLVAHLLVERGLLDLDAPVARYWPEFAEAGKGAIPVRYLLTHQAGLAALDQLQPPGALQDWQRVTTLLAAQKPGWEPGSALGYHAVTFGFLVGEVIRRITGKTVGRMIREEIAGPLGVDFQLGFDESVDPRVAFLIDPEPAPEGVIDLVNAITMDPFGQLSRAFLVAIPTPDTSFNSRGARAAEMPASNGHTNARALARIYGALARGGEIDGTRLLKSETIARATEKQVGGIECVDGLEMHFGLGFMLRRPDASVVGPRAFGHTGFGGSMGFADPDLKVGFGYVMNQLGNSVSDEFSRSTGAKSPQPDPRGTNIFRALYGVIR